MRLLNGEGRGWRWTAMGCQAAAVLAWILFVLRYQYGVASLQTYDEVVLDGLFVAAVAGAAIARGLERRTGPARRMFALHLALLIGATVISLVGAELAARFVFRHARTSANANDYLARRRPWLPGPDNSLGFREREIPPKTDRYRIVVVGDSFTWGTGLEPQERFSNLLEQFLGPRYEVLNFGLPGNNMPDHVDVLERALAVKPDFALLQLYINDFETKEMVRPRAYPLLPASIDRTLGQSSLLYDLMRNAWTRIQEGFGIAEGYVHYMNRHLQDRDGPDARMAFEDLKRFFERARAAGVSSGAVLFPETEQILPKGRPYPFDYLHEEFRVACTEEQVRCLDLLPVFSTFKDQRSGWVSPFDAHPNATVNRRVALELLQTFGSAWQH